MHRVVDLHGCILPGVSGAEKPQTLAESVQMIKSLVAQGITDIFSAPTVTIDMGIDEWAYIESLLKDLRLALKKEYVNVTIHDGARVMLSDDMISYIKTHRTQYLLGQSHFMLVTVPENSKIHHINAWLLALLNLGIIPIISDLEAHRNLFAQPEQLLEWVDKGILIQCSMASFDISSPNYHRAVELYRNGLIHFFGSGSCDNALAYREYMESISRLDSTYKQDLLSDVQLNERDLLANRVFYPHVPSRWVGGKGNFWTRLFGFAL